MDEPAGHANVDRGGVGEEDRLPYGLQPLAGGYSGETFLAEAAGQRTVVRIYSGRGARRGQDAVQVDAALLRLVRGLVPVPEVLEVRLPDRGRPGVLVTSLLPGQRLDEVLPTLGADDLSRVGTAAGRIVATLATIPQPRAGMFRGIDLQVEAFDLGDLGDWLDRNGLGWPADELSALREVLDRAQDVLDLVDRVSLVHSDFNPKNVLVDPERLQVTGLLDWEFAHAGWPYADLGNLLRFDRHPAFTDAVLTAYVDRTPPAPAPVLDLARAADLYALIELAGRLGENPVAARADALLHAIARTGDLHASPPR